uniref:Uncharacterized protein n=1 Tax=Trypanosoma vivax (strain Y486) TaxID=1055687 RepID=G0TVF4_TRYVY|nr:conserved hypothetical protein [Trypanosoma vivax Y486]
MALDKDVWGPLLLFPEKIAFASFIDIRQPDLKGQGGGGAAPSVSHHELENAFVCVLENRDVVFFCLTEKGDGTRVINRLTGPPCLKSKNWVKEAGSSSVSCCSLIPWDIVRFCYVDCATPLKCQMDFSDDSELDERANGQGNTASSTKRMHMRGVVGSSDGRVDVFSEHGFVFGFVAHDGPVLNVAVVPASSDRGESGGTEGSLQAMCGSLCFLTSSIFGIIYLWRGKDLSLQPTVVDQCPLLMRSICWCVVQPPTCPLQSGSADPANHSLIVYSKPGKRSFLHLRSTASLEETRDPVALPGSCFATTTAIASNGEVTLVAKKCRVFCVSSDEGEAHTVLKAKCTVNKLYICPPDSNDGEPLAVACDNGGTLYVVSLQSRDTISTYCTRSGGPVRSVSIRRSPLCLTVVNSNGFIEVFESSGHPNCPDNALQG